MYARANPHDKYVDLEDSDNARFLVFKRLREDGYNSVLVEYDQSQVIDLQALEERFNNKNRLLYREFKVLLGNAYGRMIHFMGGNLYREVIFFGGNERMFTYDSFGTSEE